MDRRKFLIQTGSAAAIAGFGISSGAVFAQEQKEGREKRNYGKMLQEQNNRLPPLAQRYQYSSSQMQEIQTQQTQVIQNQILPQNHNASFWDMPRQLYVKHARTGETGVVTYFQNGQVDLQGYWQITYILRDIRQNLMCYPDLKLLDLMCAVQAWMRVYGNNQPLILTSGFRSAKTNNIIEGAAKNSQHMLGKAVDFVVPGFDVQMIGRIAQHFQAGGVGIYLDKNFNHLDTASIRTWTKYKK